MHNMSYQSPIPLAGAAASCPRSACRYLCLLSIMWNTATISLGMRRSYLSHGHAQARKSITRVHRHAKRLKRRFDCTVNEFHMLRYTNTTTHASLHAPRHFLYQRVAFFFFFFTFSCSSENQTITNKQSWAWPGTRDWGSPRVSQHQHRGQIKTKWLGDVFVCSVYTSVCVCVTE